MANNLDLVSIYEQNYLNPQSSVIVEKKEEESSAEENDNGKAASVPAKNKKKKNSFDAGAYYNEEKNSFNNVFNTFMEEFNSGDNAFDDTGSDDSFEFDGGEEDGMDGDDQSFTLTELKAMTLQEICDLISGDGMDDDGMGEDFSFDDGDDSIPTESYGQMGDGKHLGNTQTRDGKPSKQAASNRVKGNGDADFSKQKTGYAPENTEGSEGEHHGNTQTRDGKPSKQSASNLVNANGNAKVGQTQRTGFGKKEGERLF